MGKGKDKGNWNKGKDKGNWHKGKDNASDSPSKRRKLSAMAGAIVAAEQRIRANKLIPVLVRKIAAFVIEHGLSDVIELGMKMLPEEWVSGFTDPRVGRVRLQKLARVPDRNALMLQEIETVDPEVASIVQILGRWFGGSQVSTPGRAPTTSAVASAAGESEELARWLEGLDRGRGAMLRYKEPLMKEFSCLVQVAAAMVPMPPQDGVVSSVDPVVYQALGIETLGHKLLFAKGVRALNGYGADV